MDAQRLPFPDGAFDVVVSDDLIEHLVETDSYAREIHRVLTPTGWLFLSTPNLAAWFNRLGLFAGVQRDPIAGRQHGGRRQALRAIDGGERWG